MILLVIGCFVGIIGFAVMQYLLTLIVLAVIIVAFLYSDIKSWYESTKNGS